MNVCGKKVKLGQLILWNFIKNRLSQYANSKNNSLVDDTKEN